MKIALYRPNDGFICEENGAAAPTNYRILSYSMTLLAATLLDAGLKVDVLDAGGEGLSSAQSIKKIEEARPEALLITLNTSAAGLGLWGIEDLKSRLKIRVIAFITHPLEEEIIRSYPFIDIVILREWRSASIDVLKAISAKKDLTETAGICFRQNKEIIKTAARPLQPLDHAPMPPLHLFPMRRYNAYSFMFSQGCNFHCLYCYFRHAGKWVGRDIGRCVEELKILKNYGNRLVFAFDDELTTDLDYAKQLALAIGREKLNLMLSANTRADRYDEELFELMSQAGFFLLSFGVESGSQDVLNKNATKKNIEHVLRTSALLMKYKIAVKYFFMIGLIHDTKESIHQTFKFITEKLKVADASFDVCVPYPSTPMYKYLRRRNWIKKLTPENLTWIYYNLYGCNQLAKTPMEKPFWRIGDLTFDDLVALERKYYHLVPHGGYRTKLGRWLLNPNFLRCAASMALTNPRVAFDLAKKFL
ncbi:B12-binding domain-containing radical SAM protein [Thermodesulfobacteriota bacterium]